MLKQENDIDRPTDEYISSNNSLSIMYRDTVIAVLSTCTSFRLLHPGILVLTFNSKLVRLS